MIDSCRRSIALVGSFVLSLVVCSAAIDGQRAARDHPLAAIQYSPAQVDRTCVDRWNEDNMRGWGPSLASVSVRRADARERADVGLKVPTGRVCIVVLAVHSPRFPRVGCPGATRLPGHPGFCVDRGTTWVCVINALGAYACATQADDGVPLRRSNATTDDRGVLALKRPVKGTQPTLPLQWQRQYPHLDGFIVPWTTGGKFLAGLSVAAAAGTGAARGRCVAGSQYVPVSNVLRCFSGRGRTLFAPCFPPGKDWNRVGVTVACAAPGSTRFIRFVISTRS